MEVSSGEGMAAVCSTSTEQLQISKARISVRNMAGEFLIQSLLRRQAADEVDQVPAICIRKRGLESRHARAGEPVRDPLEELGIRMDADDGMLCQIGGTRVEGHADWTVPFPGLPMTRGAVRAEQCLAGGDRIGVERNGIDPFNVHGRGA